MKSTLNLYDSTGKLSSKLDVPAIFDRKVDPQLIALAVRVYLANQRQATSKVKTRGEVNKTTHKVWKQKGTGRARHGSKAAPIFVGGGVAHGPSGDQNYSLKMPKKMRQLAILSAFAQAILDNKVVAVDDLTKLKPNTKSVSGLFNKLELANTRLLCLLEQPLMDFVRGANNLEDVIVSQVKRTNVYEIMAAEKILIHQPALAVFAETFAGAVTKVKKAKKE